MSGLNTAASIALLVLVGCVFAQLLRLVYGLERPDDGESGAEDDEGGGGSKRPDPPSPADCGGAQPSWWPQFERDFAEHVERVRAVGKR